ncbi:MAG: methyltransferase domain-containing protein [Anaerolineae bacterium]
MNKLSLALIALLVGFSGFCSLVYQVVWDRTLRYNFGGDSISSAIVTATFLLGLGIGAFIFGKWRQQAFNTYALVEIGIGVYAMASYYILARLSVILGQFFHYSIADVEGLRPIVVVASILFLLPPCILMGGTLPLMFNCFIRTGAYQPKTVGLIYGLNTLGAATGILAVPFLFLNHISIPATLFIVGMGNICLGVGVWLFGRRLGRAGEVTRNEPLSNVSDGTTPISFSFILTLSFISGFISLSIEISLIRTVYLLAPSSPYVFPFVLMPFLLALALGSIIFTRFKQYSPREAVGRLGLLFTLAMVAIIGGVFTRYYWSLNILLLTLPVPFLLGGAFPLLLRLATNRSQELPERTGKIYLFNSAGAFCGAMLTQFVGFSLLGTKGVLITLFWLGLATGIACFSWGASKTVGLAWSPGAIGFALILALTPWLVPAALWDIYAFNHTGPDVDKMEGVSGTAVINWEERNGLGHIEVNGQYMSALPDHPKHVRLAAVALALPRRENVLVLGLGGGGMIRELIDDPDIKHIDIVEWSYELPAVLQTPRAESTLHGALSQPKVRLYVADARVAVSLYPEHSFDVVIDNLGYVGHVGSTSIKSVTYFREISRILKPSGAFVFDANYVGSAARKAVLAGLLQNFPFVQEHATVVILASPQPVRFDPQRAEAVMDGRAKILGLSQPYANFLLTGFMPISSQDLAGAEPIFDDLLIYEYTIFGRVPSYTATPNQPTPEVAR